MKKPLALFITLLLTASLYSQNLEVIDSLLSRIKENTNSAEAVDAYVNIALEYSGLDSIQSESYIVKAITLADSLGYLEGKADALYVISRNSMLRGDYDQSEMELGMLMDLVSSINYDKGKATALFAKGWLSYYRGNYQESIQHHTESLRIREAIGNKVDISSSLRGIGITYKLIGEFDKALDFLNRSLTLERDINHKMGIAECLNHIGIINSLRGDYPSALDSYFKSLEIQQSIDDKSGLAYTYQNIGIIHYQQKDYNKTLEYYNNSLTLRKEIGEQRGVGQITYNIGIVYHDQRNYEKALETYLKALNIKEQLGDPRGMSDCFLSIGKLYSDQGIYDSAVNYQNRSLLLSEKTNSDWGKVDALITLGESHLNLKQHLKSKQYLKEGIQIARSARLVQSIKKGTKILATVENELGHYKEAYEAQLQFQKISDSLSSEAITKQITRLQAEYEFEQVKDSINFANERQKLILDQQIASQRNNQLITSIAIVVLLVIIGILFRFFRLKNHSNKRLSILNQEIKENNESLHRLNDEKNNLIGIVAHDLKGPLSAIHGSIHLMNDDELPDDYRDLKEIIQTSSSRMSKMVTEILNVEAIEKSVNQIILAPHDLSVIVSQVCEELSDSAAKKRINIQTDIEQQLVAQIDDRYIYQVIENLLSNAIKFSPFDKNVFVKLMMHENSAILSVKDEGPGINEEDKSKLFKKFQRLSAKPTANESSTGLGLSIVKQFVESMNGLVWVESEPGKGATFFVKLHTS